MAQYRLYFGTSNRTGSKKLKILLYRLPTIAPKRAVPHRLPTHRINPRILKTNKDRYPAGIGTGYIQNTKNLRPRTTQRLYFGLLWSGCCVGVGKFLERHHSRSRGCHYYKQAVLLGSPQQQAEGSPGSRHPKVQKGNRISTSVSLGYPIPWDPSSGIYMVSVDISSHMRLGIVRSLKSNL